MIALLIALAILAATGWAAFVIAQGANEDLARENKLLRLRLATTTRHPARGNHLRVLR